MTQLPFAERIVREIYLPRLCDYAPHFRERASQANAMELFLGYHRQTPQQGQRVEPRRPARPLDGTHQGKPPKHFTIHPDGGALETMVGPQPRALCFA